MLVATKKRITTSSAITLPRLELSSAMLLSKFIQVVKDALPNSVHEAFMFLDSAIALSYYLKLPTKRNRFVFHCTNKIRVLISIKNYNISNKYYTAN